MRGRVPAMKLPRVPDPRKLLAGLAAARADEGAPALDEQLRELERRRQCRARQTRERRLRKLMGPPEPPERALSLRALEQIRFLRGAFPEEWPAGRLARGFGVTPEVIGRVLRSRFRPSPERGLKQDARAGARPARPPALPAAPPGLGQAGVAAPRACLPGLPAQEPLIAAGRRPEGARGSAGKAGQARARRSFWKEAPAEGPEGPAAS